MCIQAVGAPLLNYFGMIMFYVYILKGEDGSHYCGYTSDLRQRFAAHNTGGNKSTSYQQWQLLYYEAYQTKQLAMRREQTLKHHGKVYQSLIKRLAE